MTGIYDVEPSALIERSAEQLKHIEGIKPPVWADYVKTGHFRKRPPVSKDWWYMRSAAVLRAVYMHGPIGTQKLRAKYGGKKDRGHKTEHYYKGSGSVIRKVLQQLEKAGLIKKGDKGVHKGRVITGKGVSLLHQAAKSLSKIEPKPQKKEEPPKDKPKKEKDHGQV